MPERNQILWARYLAVSESHCEKESEKFQETEKAESLKLNLRGFFSSIKAQVSSEINPTRIAGNDFRKESLKQGRFRSFFPANSFPDFKKSVRCQGAFPVIVIVHLKDGTQLPDQRLICRTNSLTPVLNGPERYPPIICRLFLGEMTDGDQFSDFLAGFLVLFHGAP